HKGLKPRLYPAYSGRALWVSTLKPLSSLGCISRSAQSMIGTYKKIARLLAPNERRSAFLLFLIMLASAALEVVGVASILPFVSVLARPDIVENNAFLNAVYLALGFEDRNTFLFALGLALLVIFFGSLALKALNAYA